MLTVQPHSSTNIRPTSEIIQFSLLPLFRRVTNYGKRLASNWDTLMLELLSSDSAQLGMIPLRPIMETDTAFAVEIPPAFLCLLGFVRDGLDT